MSFNIVAGDLEPDLPLTCTMNDAVEPIDDALAYVMRWRKPDGTITDVALTAVDLENGQLKYAWQIGDTDDVGTHTGRVIVTRANGDRQTFPSDGKWFSWVVVAAT